MARASKAAELVARLQLVPHPEGGHYGEVYRSSERVTRGCEDQAALVQKLRAVVLISSVLLAPACRSEEPADVGLRLGATLESLIEDAVESDSMLPGVMLHVEAPGLDFSWSGAAGVSEIVSQRRLDPHQPVRIASNTKTFVAAATLRLWEEGRLALDAPMRDLLPLGYLRLLQDDGYDPSSITVRHLLTHTSGLFDYADSGAYGEAIMANPYQYWTRVEQLQGAVVWGDPYGVPGEVYRYSDTGYILLGEIIERATGEPLAASLRQLVGYESLGLESTWLETVEDKPAGSQDRAHQYLGHVDTYDWHASFDLYGGGGLVSTVRDLARFMRGLFTGGVYNDQATAEAMLTTIVAERGGPDAYGSRQVPGAYRMGVEVKQVDGVEVYIHTGSWGTLAAFAPSLDVAMAVAVTGEGSPALWDLFDRALSSVRAAMAESGARH